MRLKDRIKKIIKAERYEQQMRDYMSRYGRFAFTDCHCESVEQFNASITRLYHTIEKGLSYENYRAGFGKDNIDKLITSLEQYSKKGYDITSFTYETALSCLDEYIKKNKEFDYSDDELNKRIKNLPGKANCCGGSIKVSEPVKPDNLTYGELITKRHSIRHFSDSPVEIERIKNAIILAQHTPSACNRQGWRTIVIADKDKMNSILANQNGNRGFGQEFDKLLLVTADLRSQQKSREIFQAYIDGGMYAENVINSLYYYDVGSVPLSSSLTPEQEKNVRRIIGLNDAEVMIMFIGIGNYPKGEILVARSERREAYIQVI